MISEYYDLDLLPSVLCLMTNLKKAEIEYKREHGYEATEDIQVDHFEWERFLRMIIKKPTRLKEQAKKEKLALKAAEKEVRLRKAEEKKAQKEEEKEHRKELWSQGLVTTSQV